MSARARGPVWCYEFMRQGVRYTRSGFPSLSAAQDAEAVHRATLADARLAREYGIRPPRARVPMLKAYITDYLAHIKTSLADCTYQDHVFILTRMAEALGPVRIADVQTAQLERFRDARAAAVSANTLRLDWGKVRAFFRVAVEAGHLRQSPAATVGLPRETRGPDRILTADEEGRFLAAVWSAVIRDMIEFDLWTGLRPGELCGLRWRQVDVEGARLLMVQPKTQAVKLVPLMPEAVAILLRQPQSGSEEPIFRGACRGKPIRENVYRRAFARAVVQAKIPHLRPQDVRHTCATRLLRAGVDLSTVGAILGHRGVKTTLRYVQHTTEALKRQALERLRLPQNAQQPPPDRR